MNAFPLLALPSFAQDIVVKNLDPAPVLFLTLHSKYMKHLVSRSKYSKLPITKMRVEINANFNYISIECKSGRNSDELLGDIESIYCVCFTDKIIVKWNPSHEEFVIKHLLSIFNIAQISVDAEVKELKELFVFKHVKKFSCVNLSAKTMTPSELRFLLEDIKADELRLREFPRTLEYPDMFKHRKISLFGHLSIPISSIMEMKCERLKIDVNTVPPSPEELAEFAGKWISGGLENLKSLTIRYEAKIPLTVSLFIEAIEKLNDVRIERTSDTERVLTRKDGKRAKVQFTRNNLQFVFDFFMVL